MDGLSPLTLVMSYRKDSERLLFTSQSGPVLSSATHQGKVDKNPDHASACSIVIKCDKQTVPYFSYLLSSVGLRNLILLNVHGLNAMQNSSMHIFFSLIF